MDLDSPLRTISPPVEAETLRVLASADTEFSAPEIHRLVESASAFGVRKALSRLADAGLVLSESRGSSTLWRGNRAHVLWPAIERAVDARRELIERMRSLFSQRQELAVYLYGSFARRSTTPESDIDILIVYPDSAANSDIVDLAQGVSAQVESWTGHEGQVFATSRSALHDSIKRADAVLSSIRRDAVPLVGPDFEQFLRVLEAEESAGG